MYPFHYTVIMHNVAYFITTAHTGFIQAQTFDLFAKMQTEKQRCHWRILCMFMSLKTLNIYQPDFTLYELMAFHC